MNIELELHQQLVAESADEIGGVGGAADMPDLDAGTGDIGQLDIDRLGVEARQFIFDRAQCLQHLPGQKRLGPPLCLDDRQHAAYPPDMGDNTRRRCGVPIAAQRR